MHIKKGDNVIILSGDDKGKTGKVVKAFPAKNQICLLYTSDAADE